MSGATPVAGDMDRMRFAMRETVGLTLDDLAKAAGISRTRAFAALREMERRNEVSRSRGHHHGDFDICQCADGQRRLLPMVTHWYARGRS